MARAVGLEITDSSLRILWIEHAGRKTRLLSFHEAPIPPGPETPWDDRAAEALRAAFAQSKVPRSRVVSALDSGDAILREITLPFKNDDQIRRTVRFEMESLIHNYTIEQLVVSHYKTGETDKGSLLLAAAVPKTVIETRLRLMQGAGVDPTALDLDVGAIYNAALHAGAIDSEAPQLLIYGTPKFTKLVLIEARQPRSIRTIRFSLPGPASEGLPPSEPADSLPPEKPVDSLPPADTAIVLLSSEDSAHFKALGPDPQSSLVGILAKEISRFLLASASSAQPAHILLTGEFEDFQAAKMLETATQIPVRTFNLAEALDPNCDPALREKSSRLGVPLGLALKGVGIDALGLDFRQDEFQYRRKFEALKTTALVTMELVIVFLAAIALHLYFKKNDVTRDTQTMLKHQLKLFENVSPESPDASMAYPKMKELYEQSRLMGGAELPIKVSAREAWRDLFNALENYQRKYSRQSLGDGEFYLEMEGLDITQSAGASGETFSMTFRGKVRNLQFAEALKGEVRQVELYRNADWVGGLPPTPDGMVQFTLRASKGGKG